MTTTTVKMMGAARRTKLQDRDAAASTMGFALGSRYGGSSTTNGASASRPPSLRRVRRSSTAAARSAFTMPNT